MMPGEEAAWNKSGGPMSNYFASVNRNKRSITANFKKAEGKRIVLDLVKGADIV
jgi:succinate---hydroxymethylglutarate CoA-transferase